MDDATCVEPQVRKNGNTEWDWASAPRPYTSTAARSVISLFRATSGAIYAIIPRVTAVVSCENALMPKLIEARRSVNIHSATHNSGIIYEAASPRLGNALADFRGQNSVEHHVLALRCTKARKVRDKREAMPHNTGSCST